MLSPEPILRPAVTLFATLRGEPRERVDALLEQLARQDYAGELELVIAVPPDEVGPIQTWATQWERGPVRVVSNPSGLRSQGLNRALDHAQGTYAVRVDARSRPPSDYVRRCVDRLEHEPRIGVVGGVQATVVEDGATTVSAGIQRALNNRWLLGNAAYRDRDASGAVDTVYLGAFRTTEVVQVRYDEALTANEDYDLCRRYRAAGATVWLEPHLAVPYEPREQLADLYRQYHAFGRSKVAYWQRTGDRPAGRQIAAIAAGLVAITAAATNVNHPRRIAFGAGAIVAVVALTDSYSDRSRQHRTVPTGTRVASVGAHAAIQGGWLSGIVAGVISARGRRRSR